MIGVAMDHELEIDFHLKNSTINKTVSSTGDSSFNRPDTTTGTVSLRQETDK